MDSYSLIKTIHIISVILWFSSLVALSQIVRLLLKHNSDTNIKESLIKYGKANYFGFAVPAMLLVLITGILNIIQNPLFLKQGWMHVKLTLVIFFLFYHHFLGGILKKFIKNKEVNNTEGSIKKLNLISLILLLIIVLSAVVKF